MVSSILRYKYSLRPLCHYTILNMHSHEKAINDYQAMFPAIAHILCAAISNSSLVLLTGNFLNTMGKKAVIFPPIFVIVFNANVNHMRRAAVCSLSKDFVYFEL